MMVKEGVGDRSPAAVIGTCSTSTRSSATSSSLEEALDHLGGLGQTRRESVHPRLSAPVQPAADRPRQSSQPDHADGAREALHDRRHRLAAQRRVPGRAREGRDRPPDHGQPAHPPDLDDGHGAVRLPVPEGRARDRPQDDRGVHEHGAPIFAQLNHFGLNATSDSADDLRVLLGPSAVKSPAYGETPKAMEHEDIAEVVEWWARSAELAREGGFDGMEVHIAHSYLLHQFLSPVYNKRDDEYGGSLENRLRFTREVIDEVRRRIGDDWAIGIRLTLRSSWTAGSTSRTRRRPCGCSSRGASSTTSTSARPATTTSSWRSSRRTCRTASSST